MIRGRVFLGFLFLNLLFVRLFLFFKFDVYVDINIIVYIRCVFVYLEREKVC